MAGSSISFRGDYSGSHSDLSRAIYSEVFLDALSEAGGAIGADGHYPINDAIRRRLRGMLNANCAWR